MRYWSSAKGNSKYLSQYKQAHFTKPRLGTELPVIDLEYDDLAMEEMVRLRITELLNENSYKNSTAVIDELDSKYKIINRAFENSFIICYGDNKLYREIVFINKESLPSLLYSAATR